MARQSCMIVRHFTDQEASRKERKLPRSLQEGLATKKKTWEDRCCACNQAFGGLCPLMG